MTFDLNAARNSGYTDNEIIEFFQKSNPNFDVSAAKNSGYSLDEISDFIFKTRNKEEQIIEEKQIPQRLSGWGVANELLRKAYQPLAGAAELNPFVFIPELFKLLSKPGAEEILREYSENDENLIPEIAQQKIEELTSKLPALSTAEEILEEKFGIPLTPQSRLDKLLRLAGGGYSTAAQKGIKQGLKTATEVPLWAQTLTSAGLPTEISDPAALGLANLPKGIPEASSQSKSKAPSERLSKPSSRKSLSDQPTDNPSPTPFLEEVLFGDSSVPPDNPPPGNFPKKGQKLQKTQSIEDLAEEASKAIENAGLDLQEPLNLKGRVTENAPSETRQRPKGFKYKETPVESTPEELTKSKVGKLINKTEFPNDVVGGEKIKNEINAKADKSWKNVRSEYKKAENLYGNTSIVSEKLVNDLEEIVAELEQIPDKSLSTISKSIKEKSKSILDKIVEIDPESGSIIGYKPIKLKTLTDIIREINTGAKYDFAQAIPQKKYNQLLKPLKDNLKDFSKALGKEKAWDQLQKANESHMNWKKLYEDKDILPFRNASKEENLPELFKSTSKYSTMKNLEQILGKSSLDKVQRSYVQNKLDPYIRNPQSIGNEDYVRTLSELNSTFPNRTTELKNIDTYLKRYKKGLQAKPPKAQPQAPTFRDVSLAKQLTPPQKEVIQKLNLPPQKIETLMNSRRGIKELKKELQEINRMDIFEKLADAKAEEIFREGKFRTEKLKGKDLHRIINNEKNFDILAELYGEEAVTKALDIAEQNAKQENAQKIVSEIGKFALKIAGLGKLVRVLNIVT
jgi:hypothetical protein